jgi:hypothetical protein
MPLGIDAPVTSANLPSNDIETSLKLIFLYINFNRDIIRIHPFADLVEIFRVYFFFFGDRLPEFLDWFGEVFLGRKPFINLGYTGFNGG